MITKIKHKGWAEIFQAKWGEDSSRRAGKYVLRNNNGEIETSLMEIR